MKEIYRATKGPYQYLGVVSTIDLNDLIQEFDNWCDMRQMRNPPIIHIFHGMEGFVSTYG
jgi:hypothetical protein